MTSWSVTVEAGGDRVLTREEIVALADAVARHDGVASGIGDTTYGVQILVEAPTRDAAAERARSVFAEAVTAAGLPKWPVLGGALLLFVLALAEGLRASQR